MLDIVTATTLYPNTLQPRHGIFVEQRLLQTMKTGQVAATVVAPVPWFPFAGSAFGRYGVYARVPRAEVRYGLRVSHPRYPVIPKIGMHAAPTLMALALLPYFRRLLHDSQRTFVLDAHFLYPDGVALTIIGRWLRIPVVLTARGSDVHQMCREPGPRAMVRWAVERAAGVVAVSRALRNELLALGAPATRLVVLSNGVDTGRFAPIDRDRARIETGYEGFTLLSVGNLVPLKGHHVVVEAVAQMPGVRLVIIGEGPEESSLRALIRERQLEDRVIVHGNVSQDELVKHYSSADVVCLASASEGMPNVVLESLACGVPVIATAVGGVPEVVDSPQAGLLLQERTPRAIVDAVQRLRTHYPDRRLTRAHAMRHGWQPTVEGLLEVYNRALHTGR